MTFPGRGEMGGHFCNLVFAKGGVIMSAALGADGRITGGMLPNHGTARALTAPGTKLLTTES